APAFPGGENAGPKLFYGFAAVIDGMVMDVQHHRHAQRLAGFQRLRGGERLVVVFQHHAGADAAGQRFELAEKPLHRLLLVAVRAADVHVQLGPLVQPHELQQPRIRTARARRSLRFGRPREFAAIVPAGGHALPAPADPLPADRRKQSPADPAPAEPVTGGSGPRRIRDPADAPAESPADSPVGRPPVRSSASDILAITMRPDGGRHARRAVWTTDAPGLAPVTARQNTFPCPGRSGRAPPLPSAGAPGPFPPWSLLRPGN